MDCDLAREGEADSDAVVDTLLRGCGALFMGSVEVCCITDSEDEDRA